MKIVWKRQYGGKGDTRENPIVVPISLSLEAEFSEFERPVEAFHQRWNAKYIEPHYSEASDFPWRWYGLDGGGHSPNCGVPMLKADNEGVGVIQVHTWWASSGRRSGTVFRNFFVRNATEEERQAAKDQRWSILQRNLGNVVSVRCFDGKLPVDKVWITLINEFHTSNTIRRSMFWYLTDNTIEGIENKVEWAQEYLAKKLENPEYDTDEEDENEQVEPDEPDDVDGGDDSESDGDPDPVREFDLESVLRLLRDIENDINKIEELLPK